ncbi:hypothetical protein KIN20_035244 [Parelaphostrongylus tenuis]|uniref:Uncharacterized protein n=1 Tax=Parelaphostrongylus tenuis TaxID=148309 RepID=A0AAD5RAU6_PARTN|nr:hypothetical protein KIN20_035244 [Parelaphostrongylus tenuis]
MRSERKGCECPVSKSPQQNVASSVPIPDSGEKKLLERGQTRPCISRVMSVITIIVLSVPYLTD